MKPEDKDKIDIAPELLEQTAVQIEKQVIIHFAVINISSYEYSIRIWPKIY